MIRFVVRSSPMKISGSVRAVAVLEATKGTLVFLAGFGALSLIHQDAQRIVGELIGHFHLNPAKRYPSIFIEAAGHLTDARLWWLAALAATYGLLRFVEAYGLWRGRPWAEWLAAGSGSIYIPFELYELFQRFGWLSVGALAVNLLVVGVMIIALYRDRRLTQPNAV